MTGVRHGPRHRIRPEPGREARHPGPREAWRGGKRIRRRTVANLPGLLPEIVAGFRAVPGGAVPGAARDVGPGRVLHRTRGRRRGLALAAAAARVLWPDSRPATARRLSPETATGSLGPCPGPTGYRRPGPRTSAGCPGRTGGAPAPPVPEAPVPDAVAEVTGPDLPAGRPVACPSPRLRQERARRRGDLPVATGETPAGIAAAAARRKPGPANRDRTIRTLGREANRRRVARHLEVGVTDGGMDRARDRDRIAAGARPGGVHVIRTSLGPEAMGTEAAVDAYRSPAGVGRAFRNDRTDLRIRPVHVYTADHVKAHVSLCMPAPHVEWHMRRRLAPMLSGDGDRGAARARRNSPVEPARVPERAEAKADTKRAPDGLPAHSLRAPRADLGTLTLNDASLPGRPDSRFRIASEPTGLQAKAFGLDPDPALT